jgi:hypothetical protein
MRLWIVVMAIGVSACGRPAATTAVTPEAGLRRVEDPVVQRYVFHPTGERGGFAAGVLLDSQTGHMWSIGYERSATGGLGVIGLFPVNGGPP